MAKSSIRKAITSPSSPVPVTPAVATAASQPQPEHPPSARATGIAEETQQQTDGEVFHKESYYKPLFSSPSYTSCSHSSISAPTRTSTICQSNRYSRGNTA